MSERVVGRIPVLECLRAKKRTARRLFLLQGGKDLRAIESAAGGIPVELSSRGELDALSPGTPHQGVVLEADPLPILNERDWLNAEHPKDAILLVLDGIEDPHNFGAIVRTAAACGACAVAFGKDRAAPVSPAAMKSAAGAMEYIDLVKATNLPRFLKSLQEDNWWVAALDAEANQTLWDADLTGRIAVVIGSEGRGVRRLILDKSDLRLNIPISGPITSLNASVSAAIALAECLRQRTAAKAE